MKPASALAMLALVTHLLAAGSPAQPATMDRQVLDGYTVYYSAIKATRLPDASLERHGVGREPDNVIITVAIASHETGRNVRADIEATATNRYQQLKTIELQPTVANEMVSYSGLVDVTLPAVLFFEIEFTPEGADRSYRLEFLEDFAEELEPE